MSVLEMCFEVACVSGMTNKANLCRRAAVSSAKMSPAEVAAVSVHGTGTPLGDPIEVGALGQGLGSGRKQQPGRGSRPLMLLSNKACYGHTEGSAGISGTWPCRFL
jgi:acyl transferase domain-containing protein